ncbi:hypothetical protein ASG25_10835 [Rhizobium sp. Leaf384]|uniref:hypothetical protein n=1 Tax=Rhizobium sp. Leaf384 TaxID=1736358 RepID=UPI0007134CDF|nr:hypothetical protein [Rhizobium sp. Leaf384]KQS79073.1 hypothetical protein ASG25_10835 [Rhizobium sp. Leaf384]
MNVIARFLPLPVSQASSRSAKDIALAEALNWVRHWQRDQECGLAPTPGSLAHIERTLANAVRGDA